MSGWRLGVKFNLPDDDAATWVVADLANAIESRGGRLLQDFITVERLPAGDESETRTVTHLDEQRRRRRAAGR